VQVQQGCDHRCTFCIIPFARGPSRSTDPARVVAEVRRLAQEGFGEVVLTGVDMTAYGLDLGGPWNLGRLVQTILDEVPELPRLRLSSVDPVEIDEELVAAIAGEERLMPHLHLSVQAGSDLILKRMKRRHLRADVVAITRRLRACRPDMVFGADFIAGFPTETDAMFDETLGLVGEAGLTWLHVFPFSARPGTPAARMPQVAPEVARQRARRLRALGIEQRNEFLAGEVGTTRSVLVERGDGSARSPYFAAVRLETPARPGAIIRAHIGHADLDAGVLVARAA
jgi:threonylcarbamoyladenosine tRNA methylthiotransferase MtaB